MDDSKRILKELETKLENEPTGNSKKKSNLSVVLTIVLIALAAIIALCCIGSGIAGNLISGMQKAQIQLQVENSLPTDTPTPSTGVDLNTDKTKTQAVPADFPSDGKNLVASVWGQPYQVNKSVGDPTQYTLLFSVRNNDASAMLTAAQKNMANLKWTSEIANDPDTGATVLTGNKTIGGKAYTANVRMLQQGTDVDIIFVLSY